MRYETPTAFRQALEERLRQRERDTREPLVRMRKRLVFERCMERLQKRSDSPWIVKGGFALELRLGMQARMTKDLDLGVDIGYFGGKELSSTEVARRLREELTVPGEDWFTFVLPQAAEQSIQIPGVQAYRFAVEARLDGREFEKVKVDVGIGDPLIPPLEELRGSDILSFAEVATPTIRTTSRAQHWAEKVHALTRPFDDRINTRIKDLADLLLLMNLGLPEPHVVKRAVNEIFAARRTHEIPKAIETPPVTWAFSFSTMAVELGLSEKTLEGVTARLNQYWTKLLS